jgi:hypothetical protein
LVPTWPPGRNLARQRASFVSKYESGQRRLDVIELRAICTALGIQLQTMIRKWNA